MHQAAALPFRLAVGGDGELEVLLVSSSSNRWIIPKGDIDDGMAPHLAAEKEAFEEGGVRGKIGQRRLGRFRSRKEQAGAVILLEIDVFPLEVTDELDRWPEAEQRKRRWLPRHEAAEAVGERELAEIIRGFQQ
jgi:8-oxo-dGTP pyrophosphatase MutT (NUDIX family)